MFQSMSLFESKHLVLSGFCRSGLQQTVPGAKRGRCWYGVIHYSYVQFLLCVACRMLSHSLQGLQGYVVSLPGDSDLDDGNGEIVVCSQWLREWFPFPYNCTTLKVMK